MTLLLFLLCLQDFGGPQKPPPRPEPVPVEEVEKVFEKNRKALEREYPGRVEELQKLLRDGRLKDAGRVLDDLMRKERHLRDLKRRDPQGYELVKRMHNLDHEAHRLSQEIRAGRSDRNEDLEKMLAEVFDLQEELRAREIALLKKRIAQLEGHLESRQKEKGKVVEGRLRQLLKKKDIVEW